MEKFVLFSVVLMTVVVPAVTAAERDSRLALRKALSCTLIGLVAYVASVIFIYPRLLH